MFINKASDGRNNLCGKVIALCRKEQGLSQRMLADRLQIQGLDIDKNAIQRIEAGKRFVTDIELVCFSRVLEKPLDALLCLAPAEEEQLPEKEKPVKKDFRLTAKVFCLFKVDIPCMLSTVLTPHACSAASCRRSWQ